MEADAITVGYLTMVVLAYLTLIRYRYACTGTRREIMLFSMALLWPLTAVAVVSMSVYLLWKDLSG